MPIYEYQCESCQGVREVLQKFSDKPLKTCPECGGKMHKLMSLNAFHLKGEGWYVTDYKGKNASTQAPENGASTEPKAEKAEKAPKKEKAKAAPKTDD